MRDLLEKALRAQEREYGAEHQLVATTLSNLGLAFGRLGDAQKKRDLEKVDKKAHHAPFV